MKKSYLLITLFVSCNLLIQSQVFKVGQLYYTVTDASANTVKVVPEMYPTANYKAGNRPTGTLVIPQTIVNPEDSKTYTVTEISKYCFAWSEELINVTVANTIQKIDSFAFQKCTKMETLEFEAGSQMTRIYRSMCEYCPALKSIVIPPNVTVIEDWAFLECVSLEAITLPKELKVLYEFSFRDLSGLYDVYAPAAFPPTFASADPDRPDAIPGWAFYNTPISDIVLHIPTGTKNNYTGYPWDSFFEIKEMNFPSGVKNISGELDVRVAKDGENTVLSNLKVGERLQIFDLSGKLIRDIKLSKASETIQMSKGIYVIKVGHKAGKIIL